MESLLRKYYQDAPKRIFTVSRESVVNCIDFFKLSEEQVSNLFDIYTSSKDFLEWDFKVLEPIFSHSLSLPKTFFQILKKIDDENDRYYFYERRFLNMVLKITSLIEDEYIKIIKTAKNMDSISPFVHIKITTKRIQKELFKFLESFGTISNYDEELISKLFHNNPCKEIRRKLISLYPKSALYFEELDEEDQLQLLDYLGDLPERYYQCAKTEFKNCTTEVILKWLSLFGEVPPLKTWDPLIKKLEINVDEIRKNHNEEEN